MELKKRTYIFWTAIKDTIRNVEWNFCFDNGNNIIIIIKEKCNYWLHLTRIFFQFHVDMRKECNSKCYKSLLLINLNVIIIIRWKSSRNEHNIALMINMIMSGRKKMFIFSLMIYCLYSSDKFSLNWKCIVLVLQNGQVHYIHVLVSSACSFF